MSRHEESIPYDYQEYLDDLATDFVHFLTEYQNQRPIGTDFSNPVNLFTSASRVLTDTISHGASALYAEHAREFAHACGMSREEIAAVYNALTKSEYQRHDEAKYTAYARGLKSRFPSTASSLVTDRAQRRPKAALPSEMCRDTASEYVKNLLSSRAGRDLYPFNEAPDQAPEAADASDNWTRAGSEGMVELLPKHA